MTPPTSINQTWRSSDPGAWTVQLTVSADDHTPAEYTALVSVVEAIEHYASLLDAARAALGDPLS